MKLSDLKKLVASIEGNAREDNPNPNVQFYIMRDRLTLPTEKESPIFVQFEIDPVQTQESTAWAWPHKIVATSHNLCATKGDFDIPLCVTPLLK